MMENLLQGTDEKEIDLVKNDISSIQKDFNKINQKKFEKDYDQNGHIEFIFVSTNIRAINYNIKEIENLKLKIIEGRIVTALATTTASITGIVCLQLYTLIQTNNLKFFRNCFLNRAINRVLKPLPPKKIKHFDIEFDKDLGTSKKAVPLNWTVLDKIIIKGLKTSEELISFIFKIYNVKVFLIQTINDITIFQSFLEDINIPNQKNKIMIEVIYTNEAKKRNISINEKFLCLTIGGEFNEIPVEIPLFILFLINFLLYFKNS